jgi:hypothetical protein
LEIDRKISLGNILVLFINSIYRLKLKVEVGNSLGTAHIILPKYVCSLSRKKKRLNLKVES